MVVFTAHAEEQIQARNISKDLVLNTLENPQQKTVGFNNRDIYQSRYFDVVEGKQMLIRIITENRDDNVIVISIYKTSKLEKYWSEA